MAEFLKGHPKVAWVSYAALPGNKYKALADKYLQVRCRPRMTCRVTAGTDFMVDTDLDIRGVTTETDVVVGTDVDMCDANTRCGVRVRAAQSSLLE